MMGKPKNRFYFSYYFIFLLFGISACFDLEPEKELFGYYSPPQYAGGISIYTQASFGFGPHRIYIYQGSQAFAEQLILETFLYNDGKVLYEHNFEIIWLSKQKLQIILKGEEQDDDIYLIDISGKPQVESRKE